MQLVDLARSLVSSVAGWVWCGVAGQRSMKSCEFWELRDKPVLICLLNSPGLAFGHVVTHGTPRDPHP